jgi:CRISPR system Cascade subunit CasE
MTYLTRAFISHATVAQRRLRTRYAWHQAVWEAFPKHENLPRDFLTRLDARPNGYQLLITSLTAPTRPRWCSDKTDTWQTRLIPEDYFQHTQYAFQLLANPTKKLSVPLPERNEKRNGKRVPLRTRDDLEGWIQRKATQHGFRVNPHELEILTQGPQLSFKPGHACTHSCVEFRGTLQITAPQQFLEAFIHGIGSAKAFGFGMLLVRPLQ